MNTSSSLSAHGATAPSIGSSTTATTDMLQPLLEILNHGVAIVQKGDYGTAHRIFAHLLSSVKNKIQNIEQHSAPASPATVLPRVRLHLVAHNVPHKVQHLLPANFQHQICRDARALYITIGNDEDDSEACATAPNQDVFTQVRSMDDALNCLTGTIIYNLALLHHLQGLELLLSDPQQQIQCSATIASPQQGSRIVTLLNRAKMLYGSCLELLPQEAAATETPQLYAAIWNNLAFIHTSIADQVLATDCWWQLLNLLLPIPKIGDVTSEAEAEWVSFYWTNVSTMLWNNSAPGAAAA